MRDVTITVRTVETVTDADGQRHDVEISSEYEQPDRWQQLPGGDRLRIRRPMKGQ